LNIRKVILPAIVLCVLSSVNACDGSWVSYDSAELYGMADSVISGTVIDVSSFMDTSYKYVIAEIEVEKYLKNPQESQTITVRSSEQILPEGVWYETLPLVQFSTGEKVIVCLDKVSTDYYAPVAADQGKFTFADGKYVNPSGEIIAIANPFTNAPRLLSTVVLGLTVVGAIALVIVYWKKR
jgi:hypothetical protein